MQVLILETQDVQELVQVYVSGLKPGTVFPVGYLPLTRGYTPLVLLLFSSHNGLLSIFGLHHSQIHCKTQQTCGSVENRVGGQI